MAFQQALSGLNTSAKAIDATSHNIANSSTVGFKASSAHFSDVYAASLTGAGASQIGIGVSLSAVQQQFTQGNISSTNNPLDISINGAGFFRMDNNGAASYTRSGQFHLDKNGFVVNDQGMSLTGFGAQSGVVIPSTPAPIRISASALSPVETGKSVAGGFQGVKANLNLDSRQTVPVLPWPAGPNPPVFSPDPQSYNYSTALSIYDSLGNAHNLTVYFEKSAASGEWATHFNVDGTSDGYVTATLGPGGPVQFDTNGKLDPTTSPISLSIDMNAVAAALGKPNNANPTMSFNFDLTGTTQFGSSFGTNRLEQDGYTAGQLIGLSVASDGIIQGRYSNGQTFSQGQVVLANFTNPNGLQSLGNNQWSETSVSGAALIGAPNTSNLGVLSPSTLEESNVDLTAELVNLITQQRNYQANAQSIKTQDQVLQTLVNLR
jgi:flagellar hook protein FlgE